MTNKSILPRFKLEIETSIKLKNHGVIDIIDYSYDDAPYYYIMPKLVPLNKYNFSTFSKKIACIIQLSKKLEYFASQKIYHRDIKPSNIVIDSDTNELFFIDLGLVKDLYNHKSLTDKNSRIGSLTFISPERVRPQDNSLIDLEKADVYSFGMTIWALLTGEERGFGGQYSRHDTLHSFESRGIDFKGLSIIEDIVEKCTCINPEQRLHFKEIVIHLNLMKPENYHLSDFYSKSQFAFKQTKPTFIIWEDSEDIVEVLNGIIKKKYPLEILLDADGGWLNLEFIKKSISYPGFIELYANSSIIPPFLLAPNYLVLANYEDVPFYILEARRFARFKKKFSYDEDCKWLQPVCELFPYNFTYQACYYNNDYNGSILPSTSKIFGLVTCGRFLIQLIHSYNQAIENLWNSENSLFTMKYPFYQKRNVERRRKFIFKEVHSFSSRNYCLSIDEEEEINNLISFIKQFNTGKDRILNKTIIDYINTTKYNRFLNIVLEISQYEVNNFRKDDPFYLPLNSALETYDKKNYEDYHLYRYTEHSIDLLCRKLNYFLYKYANNSSKYISKF